MNIRFEYVRTLLSGETETGIYTLVPDDSDWQGAMGRGTKEKAVFLFHKKNIHTYEFAETQSVSLTKIEVDSASVFAPVRDLNRRAAGKYRVEVSGTFDSGESFTEVREYDAGSGVEAKRAFWDALKDGGAGFCSTAAGVADLKLTVKFAGSKETFTFDVPSAPESVAPYTGRVFEHGKVRAQLHERGRAVRIVAELGSGEASDLWNGLRKVKDDEDYDFDAEDLLRIADDITDHI